ncbi:Hsp20/alpha crystallin family protein [Heyndrickxia acidicola]|uniref:Hsp20/alpha crystallin family protein n=1 Tax=Heyndrickxia acidicola TaxID=209389 RepID=A0ABU6MK30_9BACI|nr:Hsp20/alpha crystallin family protein [Heyndrickxia acidicola]MED1205039.1 Hsp20/alpha crystallin family protein [Heyndrickxia acidicola]
MTDKLPDEQKKSSIQQPFQDFIRSMNYLFQEKPVKGLFQNMDDFFSSPYPFNGFPIQMDENEKEYIISAKLSGVKKDHIDIDVFQQYITITVQNTETEVNEDTEEKFIFKKNSLQKTSRTITLAKPIDEQKVKAHYEDGLLTIRVGKEKGKRLRIE